MVQTDPGGRAAAPAVVPTRWWQWFLLYPALGVALLTAVPQWLDRALAVVNHTNQDSYKDALAQNKLWKKNISCGGAPSSWYVNPHNVKIDATICSSGDILVRAATPESSDFLRWVPVDEVIKTDSGNSIFPTARAAERPAGTSNLLLQLSGGRSPAESLMTKVQYGPVIICQRFVDPRHVLRHVRAGPACFDEIVDTYNGAVVQRNQVPCRNGC